MLITSDTEQPCHQDPDINNVCFQPPPPPPTAHFCVTVLNTRVFFCAVFIKFLSLVLRTHFYQCELISKKLYKDLFTLLVNLPHSPICGREPRNAVLNNSLVVMWNKECQLYLLHLHLFVFKCRILALGNWHPPRIQTSLLRTIESLRVEYKETWW